jgi:Pyridine nucleotide-disulphide oxidoreductase
VTCVRDGEIELASGKCVPYAYLAIATGATQSPPTKLLASQKGEAGAELRVLQARIEKAKIAIVGGGAVGVQLSADIKSFYRDKTVVLIHSRDQLLLNFGVRLHEFVVGKLGVLGVDIWLGERPAVPVDGNWESEELTFKCGRSEMFDLVVCILTNQSCCPDTSRSLVQDKSQTLRLSQNFLHCRYRLKRKGFLSSQPCSLKEMGSQMRESPVSLRWETLRRQEYPGRHGLE